MQSSWYVITGGPSTGKSTLLADLEKLGYATVPEAARILIDEAAAKNITAETLRADEKQFQDDVARLKERLEQQQDQTTITFFDRGMQDSLAYLNYYRYKIEPWLLELCKSATYAKVFLLQPLPKYEADYARVEHENFRHELHDLLYEAYASHGMPPIEVPVDTPENRVQFVLEHIKAGGPL